jgi:hypothetical protein
MKRLFAAMTGCIAIAAAHAAAPDKAGNLCGASACSSNIPALRAASPAPDSTPPHTSDAPFARADILDTRPAPIGKGFPTIHRPIGGDLIYSHYDDNGNTRSIVQFDFTNGQWNTLVPGKNDPRLISLDSRYIVFHTPHSASFPIEVIDRKTGTTLARKRPAKHVLDAFIHENRLVLFQGQTGAHLLMDSR